MNQSAGSFKAITVSDCNKTSKGVYISVWSIFYPRGAKTCIQCSVLFLCSWCQDSPLRPVRNAGNAALCSDSDPGLSWTIKSLSFNLSKKVNYLTVNKQIGFTWEYFLCPFPEKPFPELQMLEYTICEDRGCPHWAEHVLQPCSCTSANLQNKFTLSWWKKKKCNFEHSLYQNKGSTVIS